MAVATSARMVIGAPRYKPLGAGSRARHRREPETKRTAGSSARGGLRPQGVLEVALQLRRQVGFQDLRAEWPQPLDHLLPHADLWLHGHLHCLNDYVVDGERDGQPWRCRVVANPLGYESKGEQEGYREGFFIDLPPAHPAATPPT